MSENPGIYVSNEDGSLTRVEAGSVIVDFGSGGQLKLKLHDNSGLPELMMFAEHNESQKPSIIIYPGATNSVRISLVNNQGDADNC